ncbi:MAG: Hpt domain-containing protein [Alphaproteobacteria bacterium]|nr:MAG: Hpt domain-containing protein [Alphaproteobacteria bacterium]
MIGGHAPLVDRPVLNRLTADVGKESAAFLLSSLRREIESSGAALREHLDAGELDQLEIKAHALKSAARSFGAMRLGEICLALEDAARTEREVPEIERLLAKFYAVSTETLLAFDEA